MQIPIRSVKHLWNDLHSKALRFLCTRRLNPDCLENYFGDIRQENGNCQNPSPVQFQRSFKKILCIDLFHAGTVNWKGDSDKMLFKVTDLLVLPKS